MRTFNTIRFRAEEPAGGDTPETPEAAVVPETPDAPPAWSGPSEEEWNQTRDAIKQFTGIVPTVQQMAQYFQQEDEPEDEDLDIGQLIQQHVQSALAPIMPVVTTAAQKAGQENMNNLFKEHEGKLGKFDHGLAERAAQSFYAETGDPVKSVELGAKYAADVRKQERDEGVKEYKESLKRPGPPDLPVDQGGDRGIAKAKSYDEVVERWAGTTEV